MRSAHLIQPSLPLAKLHNRHADRLYRLAGLLDSLPQLPEQVLLDLVPRGVHTDLGLDGLSAEQVLRIFVLYLLLTCTFEQLEFHLADSPTYRAFCRLGLGDPAPKRASLQDNLSRLRPETLQAIHRLVVQQAVLRGVESGTTVRTDTTPVAAPLRAPTDSALLGDAVRVLERLLRRAQPLCPMALPNHGRRVRRRTRALRQPKLDDEEREALYFNLDQEKRGHLRTQSLPVVRQDGPGARRAGAARQPGRFNPGGVGDRAGAAKHRPPASRCSDGWGLRVQRQCGGAQRARSAASGL